jgi:hypothetical protein
MPKCLTGRTFEKTSFDNRFSNNCPFAIADKNLVAGEVNILNAQLQAFHQAQSRPIYECRHDFFQNIRFLRSGFKINHVEIPCAGQVVNVIIRRGFLCEDQFGGVFAVDLACQVGV